jgi:hypothetical protein
MQQLMPFVWLAIGVFVVTWSAQLLFPVEAYERARGSGISIANKGRFAYTVESLYQIKTKWFDADKKYWWHITWFNTVVSISISATVVFWVVVAIAVVALIVGFIVLMMFFNN